MLKYQEIGEILSLIDSSACDEFVLETDGVKLVVRRQGAGGMALSPSASGRASAGAEAVPVAPASASASHGKAAGARPVMAPAGSAELVSAPMVGTFYRSPSPDAPPFVEVGTKVRVGDPLCVIEVMKLFTTIHAEIAGTVREIGAENAQFVEFGQMIFMIEPD